MMYIFRTGSLVVLDSGHEIFYKMSKVTHLKFQETFYTQFEASITIKFNKINFC